MVHASRLAASDTCVDVHITMRVIFVMSDQGWDALRTQGRSGVGSVLESGWTTGRPPMREVEGASHGGRRASLDSAAIGPTSRCGSLCSSLSNSGWTLVVWQWLTREQFHRDLAGAEPGADGEGTHLPDAERAHLDGGTQQPQHTVLCGEPGQGRTRAAVGVAHL